MVIVDDDFYTLNENDQLTFHYRKDNNNTSLNLADLYTNYDKLINDIFNTKDLIVEDFVKFFFK